MALINLSVKHGQTQDEARTRMAAAVQEVQSKFGSLVNRVEWSTDRNRVDFYGPGLQVAMRVDAEAIHVEGDLPLLSRLLATPLVAGIKGILEKTIQKGLPST